MDIKIKRTSERVSGFSPSVFPEMTALALKHGAVNLGQGFPDFPPPDFALQAAHAALGGDFHQYAPPPGHPRLRRAVSALLAPGLGFAPDPDLEVTVTVGATGALFAALEALLDPGDEAIVLEPKFDTYTPQVTMAGGVPRHVPLARTPTGWAPDLPAMRAAVTGRTKLLILNTPHNPTGAVFARSELEAVAALAAEHNLFVVSDEVYDRLAFSNGHLAFASLPGMRERTVTVGSAGKLLSATGWRVGWAVAGREVSAAIRAGQQWIVFAVPTFVQEAVAASLETAMGGGYFEELRSDFAARRDLLAAGLIEAGLEPLPCHGGYFLLADYGRLSDMPDLDFCRWLVAEGGVAAIPLSVFYSPEHRPTEARLVRLAFCKSRPALEEAARRLGRLNR